MKLLVYNTECDVDQPNNLEPVEYVHDIKCCGTQTDLTASDLLAVEDDYKKQLEELSELCMRHAKAYPEQEDLKNDEKLCRFYISLSSYTVLIALLQIVSFAIHESPVAKHIHFQCFTLTLMKLSLNLNNYNLEPVEYIHDTGTQTDLTASIQWGNAAAVLGTSPPGDTDPIFMR